MGKGGVNGQNWTGKPQYSTLIFFWCGKGTCIHTQCCVSLTSVQISKCKTSYTWNHTRNADRSRELYATVRRDLMVRRWLVDEVLPWSLPCKRQVRVCRGTNDGVLALTSLIKRPADEMYLLTRSICWRDLFTCAIAPASFYQRKHGANIADIREYSLRVFRMHTTFCSGQPMRDDL